MTETAAINLNGEELIATRHGAVYWPAQEMLIVADLHFEKGASYARRGVMLPPYDTRATLQRLVMLCVVYNPQEVVSLGDAFHENGADAEMDEDDVQILESLIRRYDWAWVLGNHDPEPPSRFAGHVCTELRRGGLVFRHEPHRGSAAGELAGHLHPCARVRTETRIQRRRCYVSDGARMILPALGAYTGGLNVLDAAYDGLFEDFTAWVMGSRSVYPISSRILAPDNPLETHNGASG